MAAILIVDDDETILNVISKILEYHGYTVHKTINVAHAMAILELNWVDLILLDLTMPGKSGTYIFSYLEENFPSVKIVIHSGHELENHPEKELIKSKSSAFLSRGEEIPIMLRKLKEVLKLKD